MKQKQDKKTPVIDFKAKNWYVSKVDGKIHDMTYNSANKVEPNKKNNMKVFGCNVQLPYSGGGILVAANNLDEAIRVAAEEYRLLFDCYKSKDIIMFAKPNEADFIESDWYPKDKWKEITELTCNCDKPHVIIENGYEG